MNARRWMLVAAAPLVVVAILVLTLAYEEHRQASSTTTQRITESGDGRASATRDSGAVPAAVPDAQCDLKATPSAVPEGTDTRRIEAQKSNPASQADSSAEPMTENQAIESARSISDGAQTATAEGKRDFDLTALPAAAALVPYEDASPWAAGAPDTSIVASSRCVWAVTVHAPFVPRSYPHGMKPPALDSYTVLFDELSGQYLGLSAGTSAGELITGEHISKQ